MPQPHAATLPPALQHCLQAPTQVTDTPTLAHWRPQWQAVVATQPTAMAQALLGGFQADRLAWAFAAGYQAAMRRLLPDAAPQALLAMCLTEAGGNRPRDLKTRATLQPDGSWRLSGDKSWATFGADCSELLVIALRDDGQASDRPRLCALRVPARGAGVQLDAKPATTLVPELPHGTLALRDVLLPASALLPGDGFADYGKPFRTLEDTLVSAATLAWLLREARARDWPAALREQLAATLALLCTLDAAAPEPGAAAPGAAVESAATSATRHLVLAGALHWARALHAQATPLWAAADDAPAAQRWQRDAGLLGVAGQARRLRAEAAWARLAG